MCEIDQHQRRSQVLRFAMEKPANSEQDCGRNVWAVVLDPVTGGGCSTLDLLKPVTYDNANEPCPHVSTRVRDEMRAIALARQRQVELKRYNASIKGPYQVANMTTLGERQNYPKQQYIPGTPVERKLRAGRLLRTDGRDGLLSSSRSAPSLPITTRLMVERDTLDHALQKQQQHLPVTTRITGISEDSQTTALRDQRRQLQEQLLHVTQKLCRKYSKQLYPHCSQDGSPDVMKQLADKWAKSDGMSESEKYALYMGSRFTTQQQRDYYKRELEPREPDSDHHKRETIHTKYGNAIARSKHSLRANF